MLNSAEKEGSLMRLSVLAICVVLVVEALPARAEIILDEFTNSAVAQISRGSGGFVETLNVGELSSRREFRIAAGGNDVVGNLNIGIVWPGQLAAQVDGIQRTIPGIPITAVQFNYYFDPADVSEGGRNDAILFDFVDLIGDIQPTFLRAWVYDNTNLRDSFIFEIYPLVENTSPHTLIAPFERFTTRGGALRVPDATTLRAIFFDFFFLGHTGELNWSARIERIRFGPAVVPEPATVSLFCIGIVSLCHFRKKGVRRCLSKEQHGVRVPL